MRNESGSGRGRFGDDPEDEAFFDAMMGTGDGSADSGPDIADIVLPVRESEYDDSLAADPAGTQAALSEIAGRVATAAKNASDPVTGSITSLIQGHQSAVSDLGTQISNWDLRLADRKASLTALYNAMDTALGTLKSQQSWLTSQIAGLPSYNQSSK